MAGAKFVQYQCSWCGKTETRPIKMGRPNPGKCPRKNGDKPHTWTINKKI